MVLYIAIAIFDFSVFGICSLLLFLFALKNDSGAIQKRGYKPKYKTETKKTNNLICEPKKIQK